MHKATFSSMMLVASLCFLMLTPMGLAAEKSGAETIGHELDEAYWAIEFDVLGNERVRDLTPGAYASQYIAKGDDIPGADANYIVEYFNFNNVRATYMAMTNFSWSNTNASDQGTAPYQVLLTVFRAGRGRTVFVENTFVGLVAYQENKTIKTGVPEKNDSMYVGNTMNSELHKRLVNDLIAPYSGYRPFNESILPKVSYKPITNISSGNHIAYTFGMDYENLLIFWHKMDVQEGINYTDSAVTVVNRTAAITEMKYLNFTYKIEGDRTTKGYFANVTVTTEYDIGALSQLWIPGESTTVANFFNGTCHTLGTNGKIAVYNSSYGIAKRLGGNDTTPGFGLAVSGLARVVVLDAETETEAAMAADNSTINGEQADQNVSRNIEMNVRNVKAFKIDFESKPNYILDGDTANPLKAPVRLYPALRVAAPHINRLMGLANLFLESIIRSAVKDRLATVNATVVAMYKGHAFYAICFPNWSGKAINQDPTFTAFAEIDVSSNLGRGIDGFSVTVLALVAMGMIFVIGKRIRRH